MICTNLITENWRNWVICWEQAKRSSYGSLLFITVPVRPMGCNMRNWSWKVVRLLDQPWNFVLSVELSRWTLLMTTFRWFCTKTCPVCADVGRELVSRCSLFSLVFGGLEVALHVYSDPPQVSRATLILIYVFVQILSVCKLYWSKRKRKC